MLVVVGMEAVFLLPLIWGLAMEVVASCCWHGGSVTVALSRGLAMEVVTSCCWLGGTVTVALSKGSGHGGPDPY